LTWLNWFFKYRFEPREQWVYNDPSIYIIGTGESSVYSFTNLKFPLFAKKHAVGHPLFGGKNMGFYLVQFQILQVGVRL
jgi:hypothetical protein